MRWDDLFRDLEAQLAAATAAELDAEVADRARREAALLGLLDRARAAVGHPVVVRVLGAGPVDGVLSDVGSQWLLVAETGGREVLVPIAAVVSLTGLRAWSGVPGEAGAVFARLGIGLRAARDRPGPAAGSGVAHRRERGQRHGRPGRGGLRRGDRARCRRATAPGRGRCGADHPVRRAGADPQRSLTGRLSPSVSARSSPVSSDWAGSSSALPNLWVLTNSRVSSYIRAM